MATDQPLPNPPADEQRLMDSLKVLCKAANRQTDPSIATTTRLNHLEITLRFDSKTLSVDTLRKMAALAADFAE